MNGTIEFRHLLGHPRIDKIRRWLIEGTITSMTRKDSLEKHFTKRFRIYLCYWLRTVDSPHPSQCSWHKTMTLDVLHFIDNKGGNAEEIRESQRKRGLSVELVDEVIQMYTDWVKRMYKFLLLLVWLQCQYWVHIVDYEASILSKQVNAVQKEIAAKKKVPSPDRIYRSKIWSLIS